jgi:hypothetical protein
MVVVTEVFHVTPSHSPLPSTLPVVKRNDFVKKSYSSSRTQSSSTDSPQRPIVSSSTPQSVQLENSHLHDENISVDATIMSIPKNENGKAGSDTVEEPVIEEGHIRQRKRKKGRRRNKNNNTEPANMTDMDFSSKYTFEESAPPPNMSNMEFYNITSDGEFNLWDHEPTLPYWMKSYFNWHKWKRKTWDLTNWKSERWMVIQCLMHQDKRKCGGTSDRLKPIPTLLRIAYDAKRILLIRWTRPSMLEEFLMPPEGGLDWRVPPAMVNVIQNVSFGKKLTPFSLIEKYTHSGMSLVRTTYQTNTPDLTYNTLVAQDQNESLPDLSLRRQMNLLSPQPDFNVVFHKVWRILFTPSAPVQEIIQTKLSELGLTPNQYVASHLRALYAVESSDRPEWYIQLYAENALACATQLRPGVPIFFASDSSIATDHALKVGLEKKVSCNRTVFDTQPVAEAVTKGVVVSIPNPNPPWHLDKMIGPVKKFYDTFVDLYLMALAGCITYGRGGYGHWALLIGGNINCTLKQDFMGVRRYIQKPCTFTTSSKVLDKKETWSGLDTLLLPPMKTSINGEEISLT